MPKEINARGLACPAPVLQTRQAIDKDKLNEIKVIVDNEAALENVTRFLQSQNFEVSSEKSGNDFHITGTRGDALPTTSECDVTDLPQTAQKKIMVMITTDKIGHGDDELGIKLMAAFLKTLKEMGNDLWRLVFVNNGVKLAIEGSHVLESLKDLEESGVNILVCGTCLDHFQVLDKKRVGETTNMLDIVTSMQVAGKVVNI